MTDATRIAVAIVDDHPVVAWATKEFLQLHQDIEVVASGNSGRAALDLARQHRIDVMLLDLFMPDGGGLEVLKNLKARAPDMGIIFFSGQPASSYAITAIRSGAHAYLSKGCEPNEIAQAVRRVATGRKYISPEVAELLATELEGHHQAEPHRNLSQRELQVFLRLAEGKTSGETAELLSISVKAVSTYRRRVLTKLSVTSNSGLTRYAVAHGLIESE